MRVVCLAMLMSGCVVGERQMTFFEPTEERGPRENEGNTARFQEGTEVSNPGYGVVPVEGVSNAWMGMSDRICEISGDSGTILEDIFLDGDVVPGVVLLDAGDEGWLASDGGQILVADEWGQITDTHWVHGDVLGGAFTDEGIVLLVSREDGCYIVVIRDDGSIEYYELPAEECDPYVDIESTESGTWVAGSTTLFEVGDVGVTDAGAADQASADPTTQVLYRGQTGETLLTAQFPDGRTLTTELPSGLADVTARGGELVVLTQDARLLQLDAGDLSIRAAEPYVGPLDIRRIQLEPTGRGLVLDSDTRVKFYTLDNTQPGLDAGGLTRPGTDAGSASGQ